MAMPSLTPGRFYGGIERQWVSDLVTVSVVRHHAARAVPEHRHAHAFITLILEGHYRERIGDQRVDCLPMSLAFHPEGLIHQDDIVSDGARFLIVDVSPAMLSGGLLEDRGVSSVRDLSGGPSVWRMLRLLRDLAVASHSPLAIEEPVAELVHTLLTAPRSDYAHTEPAWLTRVDRLLDARYREPLALRELAEEAGVHPSSACRARRTVALASVRRRGTAM
jgi:AraC family transcriptional regulator